MREPSTGKCAHFRLDLVTPLEADALSQDPHRADGTRAHLLPPPRCRCEEKRPQMVDLRTAFGQRFDIT
jgi:hypothetical protein